VSGPEVRSAYRSPRPILGRPGAGPVESPPGGDAPRPLTAPPAASGIYRFGARIGSLPVLPAPSGKSGRGEALQAGNGADVLRYPWGARIGAAIWVGK
jgi:hypothetical protein